MKTQFRRIDDDKFVVLIDGNENSIWRLKGWMNNLRSFPNGPGQGKMNRFQLNQKEYHGYWTE